MGTKNQIKNLFKTLERGGSMNYNGTAPIYTSAEQAILPLAGLVLCPIVSVLVYWVARKRTESTDSIRSKAYLFYRVISGVLLGQFIGHTVWPNSYWMLIFVAAGYFLLDTGEAVGRMWHSNPNLIGTADYVVQDDVDLNEQTGEVGSVAVSNDLTSPEFQDQVFAKQDLDKNDRKRSWILACLFLLFGVVCFVNGLYLIYQLPQSRLEKAQIIICYFCNALSMSAAIYGGMIHAKIHQIEGKSTRLTWWATLTLLWSIIFFAPSIMVLAKVPWHWVNSVVHNRVLLALYGVASGAILKLQAYFHIMKQDDVDRRELVAGILVFFAALGQSMATSIWL